ncbi:MAG: hypothetical protein HY059_10035 [Proteobacteria bacterium]|nr:hypothetical protein [Pseudomonadota bacterium]
MKTAKTTPSTKAIHYAVSVQRVPRHVRHAAGKSWQVKATAGAPAFLWQLSKRELN